MTHSIGKTIRLLRRERNLTQEELAELLNVTSQAVSKWENETGMPDISQIPVLANVFDVSADILLGIDLEKKDAKIKEILSTANELYCNGEFHKEAEFLRNEYRLYPKSYRIMLKLADALLNNYIRRMGTENCDEVIELCNKLLSECTDTELRNEAISILCCAYENIGDKEKAIAIAEQMPDAALSRDDLLRNCLSGVSALKSNQDYLIFCLSRVFMCLRDIANAKDDSGADIYNDEDRLALHNQIADITKIVFCDKDFHFQAQYAENAYMDMALLHIKSGNAKLALECLEESGKYAIHFVTYDWKCTHTSPALKGYCDGGWIDETNGNRCAQLLYDLMNKDEFVSVRNEPHFKKIVSDLREHA